MYDLMIKSEFYLFYFIGIENGEIHCGVFFLSSLLIKIFKIYIDGQIDQLFNQKITVLRFSMNLINL